MSKYNKRLRILSIGNSFSVDGMQYIYEIAKDLGVEEIVLGNLYIGGASLEDHINQIENHLSDYVYYKNTSGIWKEFYHSTLLEGLQESDWDLISFQQVSYACGKADTYQPNLDKLLTYVSKHINKDKVEYLWHMTWAYQKGANHGGFALYDNLQEKMYQAITKTVQEEILPKKEFSQVIPSGTAIQNMRAISKLDNLTRDGFHLSFDLGRFIASMCWVHQLTNLDIDKLKFKPKNVTEKELVQAILAVKSAIKHPYKSEEIKK